MTEKFKAHVRFLPHPREPLHPANFSNLAKKNFWHWGTKGNQMIFNWSLIAAPLKMQSSNFVMIQKNYVRFSNYYLSIISTITFITILTYDWEVRGRPLASKVFALLPPRARPRPPPPVSHQSHHLDSSWLSGYQGRGEEAKAHSLKLISAKWIEMSPACSLPALLLQIDCLRALIISGIDWLNYWSKLQW